MKKSALVRSLSAGLLGVGLAGCFGDRSTVFDPAFPLAFTTALAGPARGLPSGSVALSVFAGDSAVVVTLRGLERLSSGYYKLWVGDSAGTAFTAAAGRVIVTETDTVPGSAGDSVAVTVDSSAVGQHMAVRGGDAGTVYTLRVLQSQQGVNPRTAFHQVLVTIETDSAAATPSTYDPLWRRYRAPGATGNLSFGNFAPDTTAYVFVATGTGSVGFLEDSAGGDAELQADLSQLSRPPLGYYYRFWLIAQSGAYITDTVLVGGLTAPYPRSATSLDDADMTQVDEVVLPKSIYQARVRNLASTMGLSRDPNTGRWFSAFSGLLLTLEPKAGEAGIGPSVVIQATVPDIVKNP